MGIWKGKGREHLLLWRCPLSQWNCSSREWLQGLKSRGRSMTRIRVSLWWVDPPILIVTRHLASVRSSMRRARLFRIGSMTLLYTTHPTRSIVLQLLFQLPLHSIITRSLPLLFPCAMLDLNSTLNFPSSHSTASHLNLALISLRLTSTQLHVSSPLCLKELHKAWSTMHHHLISLSHQMIWRK